IELPPEINIPSLRFVEAGVFAVMPSQPKHVKAATAGAERTYLLEEKIQVPPNAEFTKYIHNGSPLPNIPPTDPEYNVALFLCAVQHLQYEKTYRLAYVSDFQGYGGLLTDAQIMTSPDAAAFISGKPTLFGDGNIDKCFKKFPKEHLCNDFCRWMGLQPYATFSSEIEP
ncbi:hypothetical protein K435DRAFT_679263, partial [Dendrothele bispora CBS 962.96]